MEVPREPHWSSVEVTEISEQINLLLKKGTINNCASVEGEFISPIFLRPKPDGSLRLILNLKYLNENIVTERFKLEDLRTAKDLLRKNSFMATIDLKDAYYVVPIAESSREVSSIR